MLHSATNALRRRVGSLLIDGFFRTAAAVGKLHPHARPARHNVELLTNIPYLDDGSPEHLLDIYRPTRGSGPWPVVLYLHGGGFRILSKDTHWIMGLAFARRGFVVVNVNYRLAPAHRYPAAVEDAVDAFRWTVDHAARYGGDVEQLVLAGESAGANLAAVLTLCCCYRRDEPLARAVWDTGRVPRVAIPACGLFQVTDPQRFGRRRHLPAWVEDRLLEVSQAYLGPAPTSDLLLADPLLLLEQGRPPDRPLPPFLIQVGTRDPVLDDTRRMKAALDRLSVPCEALYYEGEPHAFHALAWRPRAKQAWKDTYRFLDRHVSVSCHGVHDPSDS